MSTHHETKRTYSLHFKGPLKPEFIVEIPHLKIDFYICPNERCRNHTVIARGANGYLRDIRVPIHPQAVYRRFPDYVPKLIRNDYEEACLVQDRSPKASATLARRCLQGMIRDFWGVTGKANLYQEIDAIKDKISPAQWNAIDALRKIGNIGAHMEKDVNIIIDVEPDEAHKLLRLIELLIEKWYIARHDEEKLYSDIVDIKAAKDSAKTEGH